MDTEATTAGDEAATPAPPGLADVASHSDGAAGEPGARRRRASPIRHGPLRPSELAEVAVLSDLALVLEVIGWFAPIGIAGVFQALAVLPFAVLAARHRLRAALVSIFAASMVAALVGGIGIMIPVTIAGGLGLSLGIAYRRGWSWAAGVGFTIVTVGAPLAIITDALDAASPGYRKLSFAQVRIIWNLIGDILRVMGLSSVRKGGSSLLNWAIGNWWVSVPIAEVAIIAAIALGCVRMRVILAEVSRYAPLPVADEAVERRHDRPSRRRAGPGVAPVPPAPVPPAPVPVSVEGVSYRYAGAGRDALSNVTLDLQPGRFLAIVGPNGCGKSTLVRVIAGRLEPTTGAVHRQGPAGLGVVGGTAVVFQRPESQVLGVRVRDDVVWGLASDAHPDVAAVLARVGLSGFEDRETSTMSGGELQRLAIASALARSPQLLVSDEATAMIDRPGREEVVALLRELASSGIAVIHVTHRIEEAAVADEVLDMRQLVAPDPAHAAGEQPPTHRLVLSPKPTPRSRPSHPTPPAPALERAAPAAPPPSGPTEPSGGAVAVPGVRSSGAGSPAHQPAAEFLVSLAGVGYIYAAGTPWAHRALEGVDLELRRGEGVVVTGPNGSGKSTLAWLLAGLTIPTAGTALLAGAPIADQPQRVGIAFQHARLQLLQPTVMADVRIGADTDRARSALLTVGLDPDVMGKRRVDDLSGGEQRRVALAGLLVRQPDLIVLDEPYAGLDDEARVALARTLRSLRESSGVTVVAVTHDLDNAEVLGSRLVHLEAGRVSGEESLG